MLVGAPACSVLIVGSMVTLMITISTTNGTNIISTPRSWVVSTELVAQETHGWDFSEKGQTRMRAVGGGMESLARLSAAIPRGSAGHVARGARPPHRR
jgi:hypothetical protein